MKGFIEVTIDSDVSGYPKSLININKITSVCCGTIFFSEEPHTNAYINVVEGYEEILKKIEYAQI